MFFFWNGGEHPVPKSQDSFTASGKFSSAQSVFTEQLRCNQLSTTIGDKLPKIATAISAKKGIYSLWQAAQILVLGSQVRFLIQNSFSDTNNLLCLQSEQFFPHAIFRRRKFTSFPRLSETITSVELQLKYH